MGSEKLDEEPSAAEERLEKIARATIEEARMVTPGIQALFGFQLVAAFDQRFHDLGSIEQTLHFVALTLVALSVALIMTPAAYHRIAEQGTVSKFFVRFASWLIAAAMIPLMIAVCLDVYIIGELIMGSPWISLGASLVLFVIFTVLWFALPLAWREGR
jgi:membrane protease YdiL (CAAX protease family)